MKFFFIGGVSIDDHRVLNTVLRLDLHSAIWTVYSYLPSPLWFHASDIDNTNGCLAVYGGCTTIDYDGERNGVLYFVDVDVRSLKSIAWLALTADGRGRTLAAMDRRTLLAMGIPDIFVNSI